MNFAQDINCYPFVYQAFNQNQTQTSNCVHALHNLTANNHKLVCNLFIISFHEKCFFIPARSTFTNQLLSYLPFPVKNAQRPIKESLAKKGSQFKTKRHQERWRLPLFLPWPSSHSAMDCLVKVCCNAGYIVILTYSSKSSAEAEIALHECSYPIEKCHNAFSVNFYKQWDSFLAVVCRAR